MSVQSGCTIAESLKGRFFATVSERVRWADLEVIRPAVAVHLLLHSPAARSNRLAGGRNAQFPGGVSMLRVRWATGGRRKLLQGQNWGNPKIAAVVVAVAFF